MIRTLALSTQRTRIAAIGAAVATTMAAALNGCHTAPSDPAPAPQTSAPAAAEPAPAEVPAPAPVPSAVPKALLNPLPTPARPLDVKAVPKDATRTESGLAYVALTHGAGTRSPGRDDKVVIHYAGWTTNGKMFDSSYGRGAPDEIVVRGVVQGWAEGLQLMKEGDKYRFWIPAKLAYGDKANPGIPSGMLTMDVELLAIK